MGMDSVTINKQGIAPIKPELDRIAAMRTVQDVPAVIAHLQPLGVNALIGPYVGQDAKNSEKMAAAAVAVGPGPAQPRLLLQQGRAHEQHPQGVRAARGQYVSSSRARMPPRPRPTAPA